MTNDLATIAAAYFPESAERAARCLEALKTDRVQTVKWARERGAEFHNLAVDHRDDDEKLMIYNSLASAYLRLATELETLRDFSER